MLRVAVIGDPGSGKATCLGLLYAALVRSGSGREDAHRFHVAYDSLDEISALFQQLMSGGFPDSAVKEGIRGLTFEIGSGRSRHGGLFRRNSGSGASMTVQITLPGSLDDRTPGLFSGSVVGTGPWRDVLDADVLLILADATKLAAKSEGPESTPLAGHDRRTVSLFTSIQRWRSRDGRDTLHPIFLLTKFDAAAPGALRAAGLDPTPPEIGKSAARAAYAQALLKPNLPRTLAALEEPGGKRLRFMKPDFFFSWVRTEAKGAGSPPRIRLRQGEGGGWELDYASPEYLALLERLGAIASETRE